MVMTSSQISQLTAQSQQMGMSQMQHAAMISQQAGFQGGSQNEALGQHMAGSAINTMSSVGGPGAQAGMALAGVDPFSMGIKGGMAGFAMGGAAGAVGGAALGAGVVAAPIMAAQYAYGQMTHGAQQQQQLRGQLGQSFQFQNSAGGRGFTGGQVESIGSQFRDMSEQRGAGGEQTSFAELSRLASSMGRMGMAQNVRSVSEFKEQFSKMLKNVKEVAKAMSTSLEEAQEMMQGMKSSGVFRNQGSVAKEIRGAAVGGGLATSEVTGMMRVGSQISRMVGGRGRDGADAGMGAIGMVGAAQQSGILSEEDIYNQTGQTGAEGRRAMSTNMLQTSARFMKSGLGRRFLASVAGKDGKVNESNLREYMAGGVGTGDTMRMAHENLGKIGRANFIRNEGRLRGAAMGAMGGLAPAMVMSGWLKSRGQDVNSDRAKIMVQRRLKMGTDETDNMMKMIQGLPQMLETRQNKIEDAEYGQRQQEAKSHTNINRLKRKFEDARTKVQNSLRQLGADFQDELGDFAERIINKVTGDVVTRNARDTAQLTRDVLRGGAHGRLADKAMRVDGDGGGTLAEMGKKFNAGLGKGQKKRGGRGYMATTNLDHMLGGYFKNRSRNVSSMEATMKNSGDWDRFEKAGFGLSEWDSEKDLEADVDRQHELSRKFMAGVVRGNENKGVPSMGPPGLGKGMALREMRSIGKFGKGGRAGLQAFKDAVLASDNPDLGDIKERLKGARGLKEVAGIMGEEYAEAGMADELAIERMQVPGMRSLFQGSGFKSQGDRNKAIGKAMFGRMGKRVTTTEVIDRGRGGDKFDRMGAGLLSKTSTVTVGRLNSNQKEMAARIVQSEKHLEDAQGVLSRDTSVRDAAVLSVQKRMNKLSRGEDATDSDIAEMAAGKSLLAAGRMRAAEVLGNGEVSEKEKQEIANDLYDGNLEAMLAGAGGNEALVSKQAIIERKAVHEELKKRGREDALKMTAVGFMDADGSLSKTAKESLSKIGGWATMTQSTGEMVGHGVARMKILQQQMYETDGDGALTPAARSARDEFKGLQSSQKDMLNKMTTDQKMEVGKYLSSTPGLEEYGGQIMGDAGLEKELAGARGKMGAANVIAAQMGIRLTEDQLKLSPD